jgi:protein-L-isoaspartate(D-aspartate) O-methyltransferase
LPWFLAFAPFTVVLAVAKEGNTSSLTEEFKMTDFSTQRIMMVDTQVRPSDVTKFPIISAMLTVAREDYVPTPLREIAYSGESLTIGGGRILMDARVFAKMLDALDLQPHESVMDLGCGLGYSTAVMARLAGHVLGVEDNDAMADQAKATFGAQGIDNATVQVAPLTQGAAGQFDAIILQGGVEQIPAAILEHLKDGGRIAAVFMSGALGIAKIGYKSGSDVTWRYAFNASLPVISGFQRSTQFAL